MGMEPKNCHLFWKTIFKKINNSVHTVYILICDGDKDCNRKPSSGTWLSRLGYSPSKQP